MLFIVKNTTFPSLLDLIAPHSCRGCGRIGSPICECCKKYILEQKVEICPNCKKPKIIAKCPHCKDLPPTYILGYRQGLLDALVQDYKYHSIRALSRTFAELLCLILPDNLPENTHLVPLPTIHRHIRERGLDHTALIAKRLAKLKRYSYSPILERANNTVQVGSDKTARKTQAETAYVVSKTAKIDPTATYILFDDVWTTGASMKSATKKLREAGAKNIIILIIALSD